MMHWLLSNRSVQALHTVSHHILADTHHYDTSGDTPRDHALLMRRLLTQHTADTLTLSEEDVYDLQHLCHNLLVAFDDENAAPEDMAPAAYVLHRLNEFGVATPRENQEPWFVKLYESYQHEPFSDELLYVFTSPAGPTHAMQQFVRQFIQHGAALDITKTSRRTAGRIRRAVAIAHATRTVDGDQTTWCMKHADIAALFNVIVYITAARTDIQHASRLARYDTPLFETVGRIVTNAYVTASHPNAQLKRS